MLTILFPSDICKLPGIIPKELLGPGPNKTIVLFLFFSESTTNSVPLAPNVPSGNLTSKLSGFNLLICPVINLTVPDLTSVTKFPSCVSEL